MGTYNLNAADLITLLQTTVQQSTVGAILETLIANDEFPGPIGHLVGVQTNPYDTGGLIPILGTPTVPIKLELLTVPTSTADPAVAAGEPPSLLPPHMWPAATPPYDFNFLSPGGVVIAAGDQSDVVTDYNTASTADTLIGGAGHEYLSSGAGSNWLLGGVGANTLLGGPGNDTLVGGGDSKLVAGTGNNVLIGGTIAGAHDTLVGGLGKDKLTVTEGNNRLVAGSGGSTLYAGSGLDSLIGATNASLVGATGNTRMVARGGPETLTAGSGADTLVSNVASGKLDVSLGSGFTTFRDNGGASATITGGSAGAHLNLAAAGMDSITGSTGAISILSQQNQTDLTGETTVGSTHTLAFTNGQTITINDSNSNITLHFTGGGSAPV